MKKRILSLLLAAALLLSPVEQLLVTAAETGAVVDIDAIQNGDTSIEDAVTYEPEVSQLDEIIEPGQADTDNGTETTSGAMTEVEPVDEAESTEIDELALPGADADDLSTVKEEYFKANVNENYAKVEKMEPVNIIWVKQTLVDGSTFDGLSLSELYRDIETSMSLIAMYDDAMYVYNTDDESSYYIAMPDTMHDDMESEVTDVIFAKNNLNGEVLDGCIYDGTTGLAYIPKSLFSEGQYLEVQMQLLQKCQTATPTTTLNIAVHNENINEEIAGMSEMETDALDVETVIPLALDEDAREEVKPSDITVMLNGEETETDAYTYDAETGEITIPTSPTNLESVEIHVEREPFYKRAFESLTTPMKVEAAVTLNQMQVIRSKSGKECDNCHCRYRRRSINIHTKRKEIIK
ncbi:MAG: hypothetical protein K6B14_09435 [Lachnospiraceae bacterium]|nr:hypothetical protein [Lachnospiraceae bacterium]